MCSNERGRNLLLLRRTSRYVPLKEPSSRKKHSLLCMDSPPKEVRIEHRLLLAALERMGPESETNDRMTYHLVSILHQMGLAWRSEYKIVLFAGEDEPEFSDEYAQHLDRLASGLESEWDYPEVMNEEE